MKNKFKNISVISTGSWVPSNLNDDHKHLKTYKIMVKNLTLDASIGIHSFEKKKKQKVSISLEIIVNDDISFTDHKIENFVSYEFIVNDIKKLISKGHIELLETLGEEIFAICFKDDRIFSIKLTLEKLDVFKETDSVGIEVFRTKDQQNNLTSFKNQNSFHQE